ncbi:hypothetical protein PBRA_004737 [Plasmodiophora brassicae]|nr:hypothetical protein PBRA_004737 [Plasmodiophora brassicae]
MMAELTSPPLRILCLHGFRQHASQFRGKTAALKRVLKEVADLDYVQGPHRVMPLSAPEGTTLDEVPLQCAWWLLDDATLEYRGWQASVDLIRDVVKERGPFDGILGFSQGACMAAVYCAAQQANQFDNAFRFAILAGGFVPRAPDLQPLFSTPIAIPSLHIVGDTDTMVPPEVSMHLSTCFASPAVHHHPGGHFIPTAPDSAVVYRQFVQAHRQSR